MPRTDSHRLRIPTIFLLACFLALGAVTTLHAQIVFPTKVVCGFEIGLIPLLTNDTTFNPGSSSYEIYKPGNYATAISMWNHNIAPEPVSVGFVINFPPPSNPPSVFVPMPQKILPGLGTQAWGCPEIVTAVLATGNPSLINLVQGQRFDGVVLLNTIDARKSVEKCVTYAAEHAFKEFHFIGSNFVFTGTLFAAFGDTLSTVFKQLEPIELPLDQNAIGGAGAGGLGLGASIDVETVAAVDLAPPTPPVIGPAPNTPTTAPSNKSQPTNAERESAFYALMNSGQ